MHAYAHDEVWKKFLCQTSIVVATTDLSQNSLNFNLRTSRQVYPTQNFEPDPFLRSRMLRNDSTKPKTAFFITTNPFSWRSAPKRMLRSLLRVRPGGLGPVILVKLADCFTTYLTDTKTMKK